MPLNQSELELLIGLRHRLHRWPEVSGQEQRTAETIRTFLQQHATGACIELAGTGFLWRIDSGKPGPTVTFRAELDALPIQETNDFAHRSQVSGVSHKCGHDGHATILAGAVLHASRQPPATGCCQFLFQPAEENGEGARAILENNSQHITTDYIFALHNLPGYPLHHVIVKDRSFSAAVTSIIIKLTGKTAHAAEPESGTNPALAMAELVQSVSGLSRNHPEGSDFALAVPIHLHMGEKSYGVSAGYGECHFTLRTWSDEALAELLNKVQHLAQTIATKYKLACSYSQTETFSATVNDQEASNLIREATKDMHLQLTEKTMPFRWGEDFGLFTQHFKGAMFGLGAGENVPALHNPDYDFPDALIASGVGLFVRLMELILNDTNH